MSRIFTDVEGNIVPDIEYRIALPGLITALLEQGVLTAEGVGIATNHRITDVTEQRAKERAFREQAERAAAKPKK